MLEEAQALFRQIRPYNALPPMLAFCIGYSVLTAQPKVDVMAQACLLVFFAHTAATLHNDLTDEVVDRRNGRRTGFLSKRFEKTEMKTVLVFSAWASLAVSLASEGASHGLLLLSLLLLALGWIYNARPLILAYRPIGSILVLGLYLAAVPMIFGLIYGGSLGPSSVVLITGWLLIRVSCSMLKDYKDIKGDREFEKRTFLIVFGPRVTRSVALTAAVIGYLCLALFVLLQGNTLGFKPIVYVLAAGAAGWLIYLRWSLKAATTAATANSQNNAIFHRILRSTNAFDLGLLACLLYL